MQRRLPMTATSRPRWRVRLIRLKSATCWSASPGWTAPPRRRCCTHWSSRVLPSVLIVDNSRLDGATATALAGIRVGTLGPAPDPALARALAEADDDVLIDLAGMRAATGPLLAARPARTLWTYATLLGAHAAP